MSFIEFTDICKSYGAVKANDNISFQIQEGSIHALVGENGAGKSTIMKIFFGMERPDSGQIKINNTPLKFKSPQDAKRSGIGMVHQHFMLAGTITATDHVILESKKHHNLFSFLDRKKIRQELAELSKKFQLEVPWDEKIENLSIGLQQRLEILKILYNQSNILILDEPTAVLTPIEVRDFLDQLLRIKKQGKTVILITHKLKEVFECADHVTVFRKGKVVASKPIQEWDPESLPEALAGHKIPSLNYENQNLKFKGQVILNIQNLFNKINLQLEKGEILGIAGVEGNGQSELVKAIINPKDLKNLNANAQVNLFDKNILSLSNKKIRSLGVGFLAEDRQHQSVILEASLYENFLLGKQSYFQKWGLLLSSKITKVIEKAVKDFSIKIASPYQKMKELSGGNQQKFVVARELCYPPQLLLACQPTRGVDISAIQTIHQQILDLKAQGGGVLLVSSELDELMKLSDRILVIYRGEFKAEYKRHEFDDKVIGAAMGGLFS